jgi:cephalosporin hydroxylase
MKFSSGRIKHLMIAIRRRPRLIVNDFIHPIAWRLNQNYSALSPRSARSIQEGIYQYTYRNIACSKNPFDLSLYSLLISKILPATIIEIGSASGGSAVWLADQMKNNSIVPNVISLDIQKVENIVEPGVRFIHGDIFRLSDSVLPALIPTLPRPLLVIEDGPHSYEGCISALEFFHQYLIAGEYIVIEDGNVRDLQLKEYKNGPVRAISFFRKKFPDSYIIDEFYSNFFGQNVTANINGYLRKLK